MYQRLIEREDVDKEHVIELHSGKVKLFFLKENSSFDALKWVESLLLDSYENRLTESE